MSFGIGPSRIYIYQPPKKKMKNTKAVPNNRGEGGCSGKRRTGWGWGREHKSVFDLLQLGQCFKNRPSSQMCPFLIYNPVLHTNKKGRIVAVVVPAPPASVFFKPIKYNHVK